MRVTNGERSLPMNLGEEQKELQVEPVQWPVPKPEPAPVEVEPVEVER
jgi:hypothetical protein